MLIFILLLIALFLLVQTSPVQTWLAQRAASYLSDELNTKIEIDKVDLDLFTKINLENVYLEDQQGDTLAQFDRLSVDGIKFNREKKFIRASEILLNNPNFYIKIRNGDTLTNVQFLSDYFKSSQSDTSSNQWKIDFDQIDLEDGTFRYENFNKSRDSVGMDYDYLDVREINLSAQNFAIAGDSIKAKIGRMQAYESSGFELDSLAGDFIIDPRHAFITNSRLKTNNSTINGQIGFEYETYRGWNNFVSEVEMNHNFEQSTLQMSDLAYFAPELKGLQKELEIDGKFKGVVENLKGRDLMIQFGRNGFFKGDITLNGMPDFEQTFITLRIKNLTADKDAIDQIPLPPFDEGKTIKTPSNFYRLGRMNFTGNFTGFLKDFVAYGTLSTAIGSVSSDLSLKQTESGDYSYSGSLSTDRFNLGKFYRDTLLGELTSSLSVEGSGIKLETMRADIEGKIEKLTFNRYSYNNIDVNGTLKENYFNGDLSIEDKNLIMEFSGGVDFTGRTPSFNFASDVRHLDLVNLNFLNDYPYGTLAAELSISGTGNNLDNFIGELDVENMSYCTLTKDYFFDNIQLEAESVKERRRISLESPIASGKIIGQFDFENLENSFRSILANVIPAYHYEDSRSDKNQHFESTLRIEDWNPIQEVFLPKVHIAEGTFVRLEVDEPGNSFHGVVASDSLYLYGAHVHNAVFDLSNYEKAVYLTLGTEEVHYKDSYSLRNLNLDVRSENDTLFTDLVWNNEQDSTSAEIKGRFRILDNDKFDFYFGRSSLTVQGKKWDLEDSATVFIDSSSVAVNGFRLFNEKEFIAINGTASESPEDRLNAELQDFDLSFFSRFLKDEGLTLSGRVDGTAGIEDIYEEKLFTSDLSVSQFEVNEYKIGNISVVSSWIDREKQLKIGGFVSRNDITPLSFDGFYKPSKSESPLDIDVTFNAFKIDFVNAFIDEGISDLNGKLNGKVNVRGRPDKPLLSGGLKFDNTSVRIDYLNTTYKIEDEAGIYPDMFTMDNIVVRDQEGNSGRLTGTVIHDNFKMWNFDVTVNMEKEPFLCMNTTEEMNELYYGKAYATGYLNVSGYADNLIFDINARSEKGTDISMPVGSSGEVEFEDFISFVDHSADSLEYEQDLDLSGISLNFELDITPEAKFKLIFDEVAGDILQGTGEGHLNLEINNFGDFSMFGTIEVQGGNYLFTLKNLINKEFTILPGGTISWYGDPFAADIDLETVYKLTAPLYDLMGGNAEQYSQRVPVNLIMELEGKLLNPAIAFDIELPNADQITRTRVESAISTDQERNRQAFALLVLKKFVSPPNVATEGAGSIGVAENSSEFLSSQISNWLSQISNEFDIGVRYRPGDRITNEEIAVALSTQLFNERLSLSGNFGVSHGTAANQNANNSNIIGDIRLEYKITEEGKIRLVVYNESNDFDVARGNQSMTTQGVGVLYREEFDDMEEFYCGFKNLFRKDDSKIDCE
ncbi:translocation/assembly module TamB domain-containing protein [Halocola ammonii]